MYRAAVLTGVHVAEEYLEICDEDLKAGLIGGMLVASGERACLRSA